MDTKFLSRKQIEELCEIDIDNTRLGITIYTDARGYEFEEVLTENEEEVILECYYITKNGEFVGYTINENISTIVEHIEEMEKVLAIDIDDIDKLINELEIVTDWKFQVLGDYIVRI